MESFDSRVMEFRVRLDEEFGEGVVDVIRCDREQWEASVRDRRPCGPPEFYWVLTALGPDARPPCPTGGSMSQMAAAIGGIAAQCDLVMTDENIRYGTECDDFCAKLVRSRNP